MSCHPRLFMKDPASDQGTRQLGVLDPEADSAALRPPPRAFAHEFLLMSQACPRHPHCVWWVSSGRTLPSPGETNMHFKRENKVPGTVINATITDIYGTFAVHQALLLHVFQEFYL